MGDNARGQSRGGPYVADTACSGCAFSMASKLLAGAKVPHNGDAQSSGGKKMSNTPGKVRTGVDTHGLTPVTLVKEVAQFIRVCRCLK